MKLLLDHNLSPKLVPLLTQAGYVVDHVREHGLAAAADPEILALAAVEDDLEAGAVVVLGESTIRIRRLPIQ